MKQLLSVVYALATFDKPRDMTGPRVQEKLALAFSLTLGQVIERLKGVVSEDIQQQLEQALATRNYLAHGFWHERNHLMHDEEGRRAIIQELSEILVIFQRLDDEIQKFFAPIRRSFGVSDELVQQLYVRMLAGEKDQPLMSQRMNKKRERLVRVWNARHPDKRRTLIFETEDRCLWQLCDIGLGWTQLDKPDENWVVNKEIQEYLPATINPRPSNVPWTYEFNLARGATLWIRPGKREKTFAYGIRVDLNS
ncbi:MAG: hypothetical protein AB1483_01575 [Candidatus Zixiibacteriota bacterium]